MAHLSFFPPEALALQEELPNHPELVQKLCNAGLLESSLPDKIAIIATHCDVLLDGYYTIEDVIGICGALTNKLKEKRVQIIVPLG